MGATRNSTLLLIAQVGLLFSGAAVNFSLGRFLGPSLYGQYGVIFAVATILNLLLTPGMMQTISKFVAQRKDKQLANSLLASQIGVGALVAAVYFFATYPLAYLLGDSTLRPYLQILTPLAFIHAVAAVYGGFATGTNRFGVQAAQHMLYALLRPLTTLFFAYYFLLTGAIWALVITSVLVLAYFTFNIRLTPIKRVNVSHIYRFALPMTLFSVLITLFVNIDLFMVKALLADNELAGYYTAASLIARIPYFMFTALGLMLMPTIAGTHAQNILPFVRSALRYVLLFAIPASIAIFSTAGTAIILLYRSEYATGGQSLAILSLGMVALTLSYLLGIIISALGRPYLPVIIVGSMAVLSAALQYVLIPTYGIAGAAVATSIISLASLLVFITIATRILGNVLIPKSLLKIALASTVMVTLSLLPLPNKFFLPFLYAGMGALYFLVLFILREVHRTDLEKLTELLPKPLLSMVNRIL